MEEKVIALGFFDGVHLGHAALLRRTAEEAKRRGVVAAAVTFDTHPEALVAGSPPPLISSPLDREGLMRRYYGIEEVIVAHFDDRMMRLPWREFITEYLVEENHAVHLVAGHDFHFGYRGEGDPRHLRAVCRELGIGCDVIAKVELHGRTVSSTYIRELLTQGEIGRANEFLGHPYTLTDEVGHGKKLGSTLGFPTVNLHFAPGVLVPAKGVYAARACLEDGRSFPAAVNIGVRPTVKDGGGVNAEGFLLDFQGDLYGKTVRLEFYRFLRPERRFESLEALQRAVEVNIQETRQFFREETGRS